MTFLRNVLLRYLHAKLVTSINVPHQENSESRQALVPPAGMTAGLLSLPQDVHIRIFESLHSSIERADATNLALTCTCMLGAFRTSQIAIRLSESPVALAHALAHILPALPGSTTTLALSDRSLSPHAGVLWSRVPALPSVTTLRLPSAPHPPPSILPARRRVRGRGCLMSVMRCLPALKHLSISLAAPHEALLYLLLGVRTTSASLFAQIKSVSITAAESRHLCHDSQVLLPALLGATTQGLERFSISMPPAILPDEFVSNIVDHLKKSPSLQGTSLALPSYLILRGRPGYRNFPKLSQLILGSIASSSVAAEHEDMPRSQSALFEHIPSWKSLRSLIILSVKKTAMDALFLILRDRLRSVEVVRRTDCEDCEGVRSLYRSCPAKLIEGVDSDVAEQSYLEQGSKYSYSSLAMTGNFRRDKASRQPRENCLVVKLFTSSQ